MVGSLEEASFFAVLNSVMKVEKSRGGEGVSHVDGWWSRQWEQQVESFWGRNDFAVFKKEQGDTVAEAEWGRERIDRGEATGVMEEEIVTGRSCKALQAIIGNVALILREMGIQWKGSNDPTNGSDQGCSTVGYGKCAHVVHICGNHPDILGASRALWLRHMGCLWSGCLGTSCSSRTY